MAEGIYLTFGTFFWLILLAGFGVASLGYYGFHLIRILYVFLKGFLGTPNERQAGK